VHQRPSPALSGSVECHPIANPAPEPIGSAISYDADVDRARLIPLVKEGSPPADGSLTKLPRVAGGPEAPPGLLWRS
jgi:hypothetical protein